MKKALTATALALASFFTASSIANTDVIIADIKLKNGHLTLANAVNISAREGYDNQPNFAPDNSGVYYTAMFAVDAQTAQTDTLFYRFKDQQTVNITKTKDESEYSPTPFNGGSQLSFIKVEKGGEQRLWSLTLKDSAQQLLNQPIKPVGYHAWGKGQDLALFVLGEPMTLQYVTTPNQNKGKIIAGDIGRSIRYNEKRDLFTFSQGITQQQLSSFDPKTGKAQNHLPLPTGSEYYTWLDADHLLSASGSDIYVWRFGDKDKQWQKWVGASDICPTQITRLNVNHNQSKIAFVCDEVTKK